LLVLHPEVGTLRRHEAIELDEATGIQQQLDALKGGSSTGLVQSRLGRRGLGLEPGEGRIVRAGRLGPRSHRSEMLSSLELGEGVLGRGFRGLRLLRRGVAHRREDTRFYTEKRPAHPRSRARSCARGRLAFARARAPAFGRSLEIEPFR